MAPTATKSVASETPASRKEYDPKIARHLEKEGLSKAHQDLRLAACNGGRADAVGYSLGRSWETVAGQRGYNDLDRVRLQRRGAEHPHAVRRRKLAQDYRFSAPAAAANTGCRASASHFERDVYLRRQAERAPHRVLPGIVAARAHRRFHVRLEAPLQRPASGRIRRARAHAGGVSGEIGGAERGRLHHLRPVHRRVRACRRGTASSSRWPPCRRRRAAPSASPARRPPASPRSGRGSGSRRSPARRAPAPCGPVPRVRPKIAPRASASQCGAPRPMKAGTR